MREVRFPLSTFRSRTGPARMIQAALKGDLALLDSSVLMPETGKPFPHIVIMNGNHYSELSARATSRVGSVKKRRRLKRLVLACAAFSSCVATYLLWGTGDVERAFGAVRLTAVTSVSLLIGSLLPHD